MTLLASVMLLASACTGKQASEKTASGLEPANFRTEVDGKQTDLLFWRIEWYGSLYYEFRWTYCISDGAGQGWRYA